METSTKITCPKCGNIFNVEDVIAHQLEEKYREELNQKITSIEDDFKEKESALAEKENALVGKEQLLDKQRAEIDAQVEKRTNSELIKKEREIKEKVASDFQGQFDTLLEDWKADKAKIATLQKTQIEFERLQRKFDTQKAELEIEYERKMTTQMREEAENIQRREAEKNELKFREQQKIIDGQKDQMADMQRKLEQGSIQLQGEVQELAIEEWLAEQFPLDNISEIKKGARGADCIHTVHTHEKQNHGSIYYESKRTKDYQKSWIEKFRNDMREKGANIGVLVTDAMPPGMDRMGLKDGVWICSFEEFKGLCFVLRESIIAISGAISSQENKGDKMNMLYSYLTGNEFRLSVEAIVEGFTQMQTDLNSEKRSIMAQWNKREKQIEKVLQNTVAMHGSIRGIAGNEIPTIQTLELPEASEIFELDE